MKKYKILLTLGSASLLASLPMVAASCGGEKSTGSQQSVNVAGYIDKSKRVASIREKQLPAASSISEETKALKMVLVTDEGNVDDKSFNQSAWEALNVIFDQTSLEPIFIKPNGSYEDSYRSAIDNGARILVLPGFKHQEPIEGFIAENIDELKQKRVHIVTIDFTVNEQLNYPYAYGLQYKMKEAAYVVGYATAAFLADKYGEDQSKRLVSSFGGGPFPGVTDFNEGFLKGLYAFANENPSKKVIHTSNIQLDSGFVANDTMTKVVASVISSNPSVILPVAGPATGVTLDELAKAGKSAYVIGVDVDQSLAYKQSEGKFLTSITKGIGQSVYDIVTEIMFPNVAGTSFLKSKTADSNFKHFGTLKEGWVGYVQSTLSTKEDKDKMNKFLAEVEAKFSALTDAEIEFINSNKALPNGVEIEHIPTRLEAIINAIKSNNS